MTVQTELNETQVTPKYTSQQLEHLGLIAGMYDELGIGELLDSLIKQDTDKRIVTLGQAVKAMVLNGLGFVNRALYLSPHFFSNKPLEKLIGEGIKAEHLNDDVLGRALDDLYEAGLERLYVQVASQAVNRLGVDCQFGHMDSTSFHVDGQYNEPEHSEEGEISITKGYSRDHRPDLNQVVLQFICERQAGIPLIMQSLDGNNSDKESFRNMVNEFIGQMQAGLGVQYVVADSAFYTADTLKVSQDFLWISRVPETINLAVEQLDEFVSQKISDLRKTVTHSVEVEYAGIKQRWLVVYSPQAYQRASKTVDRQLDKQSASEHKKFNKLCKQEFACETDARNSLEALKKTLKATSVKQTDIECIAHYKEKGRPAKDQKPDSYTYRIKGDLQADEQEKAQRAQRKSCFIVATNQLDSEALPDDELLDAYKNGQQKVERGFRFLKDPLFLASTIYLKSTQRIMSLMMIMTLCLLIYSAIEYRIREALRGHNATFPNQKGKEISNPTGRWVFQYFTGIQILLIDGVQEIVLNLNEHHKALLRLLGERYEDLYNASD